LAHHGFHLFVPGDELEFMDIIARIVLGPVGIVISMGGRLSLPDEQPTVIGTL
jgi:hypothetical protein